jgi:hypothetical protein
LLGDSENFQKLGSYRKEWNNLEKDRVVDEANISNIINELFMVNILKGCGHFARSIIRAQSAPPHNTQVYACLVSVINVFINIVGDYISKKTIISFCRLYEDNDKAIYFSTIKFIAYLINQNVVCIIKKLKEYFLLFVFYLVTRIYCFRNINFFTQKSIR